MTLSDTPDRIVTLSVQFAAMVFDTIAADIALQSLAKTLGVTTLALGRIDPETGSAQVLAQNREGVDVRVGWSTCEDGPREHYLTLSNAMADTRSVRRDVLILQTSVGSLTPDQRASIDSMTPLFMALWAARKPSFEQSIDRIRIELRGSILHADNPSGLSRSEIRICELIAQGHTTAAIVTTLDVSMATVRTHLRHIYAKTGLDGMVGVLHHLQSFSDVHKADP